MEEIRKIKASAFDKRIHEIDLLRGFLILLVVMDHLFINFAMYSAPDKWNIGWMYGFFNNFYWQGILRDVIQPIALMAFCFVSGISCAFSKNNLKRSLLTIGVAVALAGVTHVLQLLIDNKVITFMSGLYVIDFNIIGVLGLCMLIYTLIQKRSWKIIAVVIIVSFLFSSYIVPDVRKNFCTWFGSVRIEGNPRPGTNYDIPKFFMPLFWEPIHSIAADGHVYLNADYVPLFPYAMFFFSGALVTYFVYREKKQSIIKHKGEWERPICFLGRHTMIIYLAHILVISGIFALINLIVTSVQGA